MALRLEESEDITRILSFEEVNRGEDIRNKSSQAHLDHGRDIENSDREGPENLESFWLTKW